MAALVLGVGCSAASELSADTEDFIDQDAPPGNCSAGTSAEPCPNADSTGTPVGGPCIDSDDCSSGTVCIAPFDGEVAQTFVETGEFVGAGSPVVRLLGVGPQDASFAVAPEDAAAVEALGTVDLLTGSGAVRATITRLERLAEQARLVTVLAQIDPDAPRLPSGTLAEVRYTVALGSGLIVPSGALAADAGRSYVYVVAEERAGTIARRLEVRVVAEAANLAVIEPVQAGALAEGALVIAPRPLDVRDGTAVRVIGE